MKRMARIAQTVGLAVGGTMGLAGMGMMRWYRRALPQTSGTLLLPGLRQSVQVLRDRWGIPHIYAEHNADLFRALGYVHAQDRLWQMELNRRTGQGRLAEIFGERLLATDRFIRTLGFNRLALGDVALLDESTYEVVHAYVGGINAYIEQHMKRLPLEFTLLGVQPGPWDLSDVVVWGRVMALNLSVNWKTELLNARLVDLLGAEQARSFMQQYIHEEPITVPAGICYGLLKGDEALRAMREAVPLLAPEQAGQGSNAWVLGGERTAEGKPLLANDTHLLLSMPCSWYEAHLEGGDYRMVGATLPGLPTVLIGHNERITWGITNALIDVQDLFIERFDPANPRRYAWQDGWREADVLEEEIMVRGGVQPVRHHVRITHHGPVITPAITPALSPLGRGESQAH
ncbi:MAG: penicillin acylase family protein [Chloroflexaceae bacterium]|nr:penicillin acylase family protein [Chloroflexaceae bacterium]